MKQMTPPAVSVAVATLLALASTMAEPALAQHDPASAELPRLHRALQNVRLLTQNPGDFAPWDNAECYFSPQGDRFVFQATREGRSCDAIYTMSLSGEEVRMISNGKGRTTCAYFSPDGRSIIFSSTHLADPECPPAPDMSQGYTWAVYPGFDIFRVPVGGGELERLTTAAGYDAEAVYRPDGKRILFTSTRDGDLDLYDMAPDGTDVRRLTDIPGYDGGAFYTADGSSIVFRARHPEGEELEDYRRLLDMNLIRPSRLDLYIMDGDGQNLRRLTHSGDEGATNWAPYPHPDGRRIVFASNRDDFDQTMPGRYGFNFELYLLEIPTRRIHRLTYNPSFDGFPMFSFDGRKLVWCGNYVGTRPRDTDVLVADWDDNALR